MEIFLTNLKQDLQCSLCNNTLTDPKLLQCFHTFCKSCIQRHAQPVKEQVHIFKCPKCSFETLLQELNNVEDLQPSPLHSRMLQVLPFLVSEKPCSESVTHSPALCHCFECAQSMCGECLKSHAKFTKDHQVVSFTDINGEDLESMFRRENPCKTHLNHTLQLFCNDCKVLVCMLCLNDHKNHKTLTLQEFIVNEKNDLSENIEDIKRLRDIDIEKKQQEKIAGKVKSDAEKAKKEVKKLIDNLVNYLRDQERQLLHKIEILSARADRNLRVMRHIPAAEEYLKSIMEKGNASDMFDGSNNLTFRSYKSDTSGIVFCLNENLSKKVETVKLGDVRLAFKSNSIFSKIQDVRQDLKAMEKAKLSVITKTSTGDPNNDDCHDVVDIQFSPKDDVKVEEKTVKTGNKIQVEFMPRVPGQLTAEVKLNGNPVSNSPLRMNVKPQHMKEKIDSRLKKPLNIGSGILTGIAANKDNTTIAVADSSKHCIKVFNMNGELLRTYGSRGSKPKQLKNPQGLAFLNDRDLVIVDSDNNRLCVVNTKIGTLVKTFGCQGNDNGEFSEPNGVHVDDDGNIIVSDTGNRRVQVFTKDGDYKKQFTVQNQDNFKPHSTVTHNGLFYVSDWKNGFIHVIQRNDDSPTETSSIGPVWPCLDWRPGDLAIDKDHNLLIVDSTSKVVKKFRLDGRIIGETSKLTAIPSYIEVLKDGQVVCTSHKASNGKLYCFLG